VHIAIDYTPAVRQSAGIGRLTRHLARELTFLHPEHAYTLFVAGRLANKAAERAAWPAHVRLRDTLISERALTILWHRLRVPLPAESFTGPCDLFHSTDFVLPPTAGARSIVTVHDLTFLRYPECAHPRLRAYLQSVVPRSVQRADRIIADSEATRRDLIELLGAPAEKIGVVYGGIEDAFTALGEPAADAAVRRRHGLEQPYIFSVGTIEPRKNYALLLRAYARAVTKMKDAPILAIAGGKGWLYDDIFAEVERCGLHERVRFLGFVPDADLPALYRGATLFVFPSLYEGFGFPPLEAMACGCPVVCSNASSLPEVVGDAAVLAPPTDEEQWVKAMRGALKDSSLREAMQRRGLAQAARFTWTAAAGRLWEEYQRALGKR
jgi:glycosyltransferase involved in cell wall biosynthesis